MGRLKMNMKVKIALRNFFLVILGARVLAENVDDIANKYNIDKDIFSDAVYDLYETVVKKL